MSVLQEILENVKTFYLERFGEKMRREEQRQDLTPAPPPNISQFDLDWNGMNCWNEPVKEERPSLKDVRHKKSEQGEVDNSKQIQKFLHDAGLDEA